MTDTRYRIEQLVLGACLPLMAVGAFGAWLLSRPDSWLSKAVDRAVTLPEVPRG